MRKAQKPVSRSDVAKLAGVSVSAVSLVLNKTPDIRISEPTRKRIFDAAKKIGYRPSAVARALVTGKTNIIGVSIYYMDSPFDVYTYGILSGFWKTIREHEYRLTFNVLENEDDVSDLFREKVADGMLLIAPPHHVNNLDIIQESHYPTIVVGSKSDDALLDYVDVDNIKMGKKATEILIKKGHRDILHISGFTEESSSAESRIEGYKNALLENDIAYNKNLVIDGSWRYDIARAAVRKAFKNKLKFSAIFAASDSMARAAIDELLAQGLQVPKDCSVIGVNQDPHYCYGKIALATFKQPLERIGLKAAELLIAKIKNKKISKPKEYLFPAKYIPGDSVGKCR